MALPAGYILDRLAIRPDDDDEDFETVDAEEDVEDEDQGKDPEEDQGPTPGLATEEELEKVKTEVVEGNKKGSNWLIVEDTHICHKHEETKEETFLALFS